jgi:D-galacturonate reductase
MRYVPDAAGRFAGQTGYGYRSIEAFVEGCSAVRSGAAGAAEVSAGLASVAATLHVTAILEAGRRSLDAGGAAVRIVYEGEGAGEGGAAAAPAAGAGGAPAVNVLAKPAGFA